MAEQHAVAEADEREETEPVENTGAGEKPEGASSGGDAEPAVATKNWRAVLAAGLVVVFGGLACWFAVETAHVRGGAADNAAYADTTTTTEVLGQVDDALAKVFSYAYDNPGPTDEAAAQVLGGHAKEQYQQLFAQVRAQAPAQKLAVRSRAVLAGVKMLDGDHATVLAFLDQSATRGDAGTDGASGAQLTVTAERQNGRWIITDLKSQ
ncbi:hypothetical protein [Amycolatopsis sp. CA-230715]|uniref:hypothetical protein n=1 Tax=Amycolatopsis sp. CA-230715 TaxID=2745196 RepID=UPI001C019F6D|nr:hypothetical protein [Amycolatopsis sp. CA-230715]QWF83742.1 hypothetical protein HUW46_07185 [Amycolatopsis sp. CA-230715]